jgi:hypothetical protein
VDTKELPARTIADGLRKAMPGLCDLLFRHAEMVADTVYENEATIGLASGGSIRVSAAEFDYVRICDEFGAELMYWNLDEIIEDPSGVLGAIFGIAGTVAQAR